MAGNEQVFDEIVSPIANKQVKDLTADLAALDAQAIETAKTINTLNTATANSKTFTELQKNSKANEDAQKKAQDSLEKTKLTEQKLQAERDANLQKQIKQRQQQQAAQDKATQQELANLKKLQDARQKAQDKEAAADQKDLASMAKIARQREKDASAFKKLLFDRDQAREKARNVGATFGTDNDLFRASQKEFEGFQKQVDSINNKLGNFTDNVGNYAGKAFGLIRQLAYILPGIGIAGIFNLLGEGVFKFYQALASGETIRTTMNNLERKAADIYADQITNVNLLVAETKNHNTTTERRQAIIEELNKISPVYFGNLKSEQDIVSKLPDDYKAYNEAILENSRAKAAAKIIGDKYKQILQLQRDIIEGADNANPDRGSGFAALTELSFALDQISKPGKEHQIKMLQEQIQRLMKSYTDSSIKAGDVTGEQLAIQQRVTNESIEYNKQLLQNRIDINNDIAGNDKKSYSARYTALKTSLSDQIQLLQYSATQEFNVSGLTADQEKAITDKNNFDILKANQDYIKKKRDLDDKAASQDLEHLKNTLQAQKDAAKLVIDDPNAGLDKKQGAIDTGNNASLKIIQATYKAELTAAGENAKSIKLAEDNKNKALKDLAIQYQADQERILKEAYDSQLAGAKKHDADLLNQLKTSTEERIQEITKNAQDSVNALDQQFEKGQLNTRVYEAQRIAIIQQSEDDILNERIKAAQNNIKLLTMSGIDASSEQKKLSDLELQQFKTTEQRKTEYLKQEQALRDQLTQSETALRIQAEQTVIDTVKNIVDANFENQIANAQKQSDLITTQAQEQKDIVDGSLLSAKDKADKDAIIEAKVTKDKERLAVEQGKIKQKEAEFNKEVSMLNVLVSTAEAVGKIELQASILAANPLTLPLVPLALAQIPIAIASGALQEAAILATPIPKYAKGTKNYPGGIGVWGEAGTERATLPTGETIYSGGTEIANFPKGTVITPHLELRRSLSPDKIQVKDREQIGWKELKRSIDALNKPNKKTVTRINISGDFDKYKRGYFK